MSTPPASLPRIEAAPAKTAHVTRIQLGPDISVEVRQSEKGKVVRIDLNVPADLPVSVTES